MKKVINLTFLAVLFVFAASFRASACTNFIITRGASANGSILISYAADSHQLYGELYFRKGGFHREGEMRKINEWDTGRYLGEIPEISYTFQRTGNANEKGLVIGETTYGGRELENPDGILDYGSLIYIALERCSTAREAIAMIADLTSKYGYCSEGESFSIADKEEVWVMDLIGKGSLEKGIVWVARKVPDGYISGHANQSRISTFPKNDPENCLYAEDVISFARKMGFYDGSDDDFSFCDTYNPLDFGGLRACEARVWSGFNILGKGYFVFEDENGCEVSRPAMDYVNYAMGYDYSNRFPLFIKPAEKVTVKMLADVMRDHYEGTPMDMTTDIGAGGNALPYRWRPMSWQYDGKTYLNERAIATQQTGFWFVGETRKDVNPLCSTIVWFGTDDAATSYLTPIYVCIDYTPESFREGNGSILKYSTTSAFWITNRVANDCYKMYDVMAPSVRKVSDEWERRMMKEVLESDAECTRLCKEVLDNPKNIKRRRQGADTKALVDPYAEARRYLTRVTCERAADIFAQWQELEIYLTIKYLDGNIKAENEDGSWRTNGNGDFPAGITNRPYSEKWREAVVKDNGVILEHF